MFRADNAFFRKTNSVFTKMLKLEKFKSIFPCMDSLTCPISPLPLLYCDSRLLVTCWIVRKCLKNMFQKFLKEVFRFPNKLEFWNWKFRLSLIRMLFLFRFKWVFLSSSSGFRMNASSWPMFLLRTLNGAEMAPVTAFKKVPFKCFSLTFPFDHDFKYLNLSF